MVGISAHMRYDLTSFLKFDSALCKKTDQLRNYHTRMCIIDLDHCVISKVMKIAAFCCCLIQDQLCCIANHEILLINTKLSSCVIAVIWIQKQCQIVEQILLIKGDSLTHNALVCNINIKKTKLDRFVLIACNINIIQCGFQHKSLKRYIVGNSCICKPALRLDPRVRCLKLKMIFKLLFEKSEVIIKSDSFSRKSQSCNGIQEACCQTAKTAVSKSRISLLILQKVQVQSHFLESFLYLFICSQVDQVISKCTAHQEFHGHIVQNLRILFFHCLLGFQPVINNNIFYCIADCLINFLLGSIFQVLSVQHFYIFFHTVLKSFFFELGV